MKKISPSMALAAALAFGAAGIAKVAPEPPRSVIPGFDGRDRKTPGPGWSFAHVKRMAKKARNVTRNRRAHR